ncbi:MAG: ABC transporter permease [Actinomycetota bacterium]|nr:ABC transporter permease [Actinomycetota bacterium]
MNAVYILWLRQLKRYFRSKSRIVGALGQPLLFLFALGFGFGPIYQQAGQGDYIQFLVPGIMAMTILFTSMFTGIEIIWDRQFGFLKETLVAPVSRFHIMLGRSLGGATIAIFQGFVVFSISFVAGFKVENWLMAPIAIVFMFLTAMLFTALGTAIASFLEDMQGFQLIMSFLIMPTFFLSGALFPLEGLPGVLTYITMFNPLSYGVDALRGALIGSTHFGFLVDFAALGIGGTILLFIGGYLFSKVQI